LRDKKVYTEESINNLPDLIYSLMLMSMAPEDSAQKGDRVAKAWLTRGIELKQKDINSHIDALLG
jgi:hypothetical protein